MGSPYDKFQVGQPFRPSARQLNKFVDAARPTLARDPSGVTHVPLPPAFWGPTVLARNEGGSGLGEWSPAKLRLPLSAIDFGNASATDVDRQRPVLLISACDAEDDQGMWCITQEPIAAGQIGRVCVCGVTLAKILVEEEEDVDANTFVVIKETSGPTFALHPSPSGSAQILWRETTWTTDRPWAILRLGNPGSGGRTQLEGKLDEDLAASSSGGTVETTATLSVWSGDGAAWADTGEDVEITNRDDYLAANAGDLVVALRMGGEWRPVWVTCAQRNEFQKIVITGTPTGGTFTLTFLGQTTSGIAYNASAATVQSALEALSNVAPGDVLCTGGTLPGTAVTVEFSGAYTFTNVPQMTAASSLTGGTSPTVVVSTDQPGCCG